MLQYAWYIVVGMVAGAAVGAAVGLALAGLVQGFSLPFVLTVFGSYVGMLIGNHRRVQLLRAAHGAGTAGSTEDRQQPRQER